MPPMTVKREIAFLVMDVARMLRTYADQRARQFGISRAQWGVLVRLDRSEGLKQSELAEILDLQPISLTRLLDRLAAQRPDRAPARPQRPPRQPALPHAGRPAVARRLADLGHDMMETVLDGLDDDRSRACCASLAR